MSFTITGAARTVAIVLVCTMIVAAITGASNRQSETAFQSSMKRGLKVYTDRCLACHFADGGGVQRMNPPIIKTKWVLGDKNGLIQIILKGMNGEVIINGISYHNVMASHSDLSDLQIADVLTYIRNSFGNKAKAITATEVNAVRKIVEKKP